MTRLARGRRATVWLPVALLAVGATGCARAHAKASPDGPALQVPQPPARVIAAAADPPPLPVEEPPVPPPALPAPPAVAPRPAPSATPRAPRPDPPAPPPARVEPRTLRAPGDLAREQAIRERLVAAAADIGRVDVSSLGGPARAQYDQARRFLQQAEQAIKDQNLAFASTLADKAAALAADLAGR